MSKLVNVRDIPIGGSSPVSIQSMTNVDTRDSKALLAQIEELRLAGCQIIRVAIPDNEALDSFALCRAKTDAALVADIHFDYRLAIGAIEAGADKIRINPGNIGGEEELKQVVAAAKARQIPIRVGVNSGSLKLEILKAEGGVTAGGLVRSALETLALVENLGYDNLVVSIKSSNVELNYQALTQLSTKTEHPLHIGITEAGTPELGQIKSAIGIGSLLLAGVGDTIRVSLTSNPLEEVRLAQQILMAIGKMDNPIEIISCPTCGRTEVDLISLANKARHRLDEIARLRQANGKAPLKVAIMGCIVNGPGEAKEADYGIAGGKGRGIVFAHGEIRAITEESELIDKLIETILNDE